MRDVTDAIRGFIQLELLSRREGTVVTDETRLLRGVTDSLGIMHLIAFLQEEFGVTFTEADAAPENFQTVGDVERLVRRRLEASDAAAAGPSLLAT